MGTIYRPRNHILHKINSSLNHNIYNHLYFFLPFSNRNWLLLEDLKGQPPWFVWREPSYCQWKKRISSLPRLTLALTQTCKGGWNISSKKRQDTELGKYLYLVKHPKGFPVEQNAVLCPIAH